MTENLPVAFLKNKMSQLPHALFYSFCNSMLNIPVQVVHPLFLDEFGQVWMTIPAPKQKIHEFEREFPSKLDFYQKGINFYLKVAGKAYIVTDPEELNGLPISEQLKNAINNREFMLVKVRIQVADYFEHKAPVTRKWVSLIAEKIQQFFHYDRDLNFRRMNLS